MRISFIIPCLTEGPVLERCLRSIGAQQYPPADIEVIVVDDASPQPLEETCREFQRRHPRISAVIYRRNAQNSGRARTRNVGLALATGDVIVFLDVDNVLDPQFTAATAAYFREGQWQSVLANATVPPATVKTSAYARFFNSRFLGMRRAEELRSLDLDRLPHKYFATSCIAVSREALERAGGFDEDFRHYGCEDEEISCRLAKLGVPLRFARDARALDMDDRLDLKRACDRLVVYAQQSVPIILTKHPDYADMTMFALFEKPEERMPLRARVVRRLSLLLLRPRLGASLRALLGRLDGVPPRLQPPALLYRVALTCYYLQGYRRRAAQGY